MSQHPISIAPMMKCTDRHYRYFLRLISRHVLLYTEMITSGAILHGDKHYLLDYDPQEHPLALQIGGSNPEDLAQCAKIAEDYGYDEVNLNVGCPSDRVQSGRFGACLMKEPELVAQCVHAMVNAVKIPITVKTRIGVDEQDSYEALTHFIQTVANVGCDVFIIHARKAWLKGLSPKENREVPPLRYDVAYQLKRDFPKLTLVINGGVKTLDQAKQHLQHLDGVMIGREAYYNPYLLAEADQMFYGAGALIPSRHEILNQFFPYVEQQLKQGIRLAHMVRPLLGLFQNVAGARMWRRYLSENIYQPAAGVSVIEKAALQVLA